MSSKICRILSLDGGGIRGLFSATFLEKFCNDAGINGNELWKYFDIICGTSIGGIQAIADVRRIIAAGADKISLNSAAIKRPELIREIAGEFGSQCVVVAMDVKCIDGGWKVFVKGGREETAWGAIEWAKKAVSLGAGEILLTSMNNDGTKKGFALDITQAICKAVNVPVIASGGAGSKADFEKLFQETDATGGLAASIFHYNELPIPELKSYLKTKNIPIR